MTRQAAAYRKDGSCWPATRRTCIPRSVDRASTPVCRMNLGWKLAQVVSGTSPETLLDTHHAERHPVAARVLRNTMAQVALMRPDDRIEALRESVTELLSMDEPRDRFAAMMSGLDIHYDLGEGHPLLGRRMPDLDLGTADGLLRTFTLLHDARPVLLNLGEPRAFDITPWSDRVQAVDAAYAGAELPALGAVTAPTAVLIRPDGYVAWVGDRTQPGLADALTTWFDRRGGSLDDPAADGVDRRLDAVLDLELHEDVRDVVLDRLRADEQLAGDLGVVLADGDQPQDSSPARRARCESSSRRPRPRSRPEALEELRRDVGRDQRLPPAAARIPAISWSMDESFSR